MIGKIKEIQENGVLLDEGLFDECVVKKYFLNDVIYLLIKKDNWEVFDIREPSVSDIEQLGKVKITNRDNIDTSSMKEQLVKDVEK